MPSTAKHIIERARIDVSSPTGSHALQKGVASWWSAAAVPAIEEVLEELLPEGAHLRLDRLDLDLGHFKRLDPDLPGDRDELTKRLKQALRKELKELLAAARADAYFANGLTSEPQRPQQKGKETSSSEGRRFAAWLYFLEFGHRPWWWSAFPPAAEWGDFIAQSLSAPERRKELANLTRRSRSAALRLAADGRHSEAFKALLTRNRQLKAAWKTWLAAAPAYADLAAQLPVSAAPPATEWATAGGVVCWWFLLTETNFKTEVEAIKEVLTRAIPKINIWPEEEVKQVLSMLKLPATTFRTSLRGERQLSTEEATQTPTGETPIDKDVIPGEEIEKEAVRDNSKAEDQVGKRSADGEALPGEVAEKDRMGEDNLSSKKHIPLPSETVPKPEQEMPQDEEVYTMDLGSTDDAGRDVPETMAWSEASPETSSAPAAAPQNAADAWYVDHAGVVLTHPFLVPLFTGLGYWADGAFVDATAQQRAVYLTHYLATGAAESHEEDLPLCKLLCGWPVSGPPAQLTVPLTATDRHEADEVLRSVIEHWSAIGAASLEGLREGFFAREGRLRETENGWQVTVDRRAQDILLGRLPWGISMVQGPWHESYIKVEW